MSNKFQDGFASVPVRGIPLTQAYPGEVFYVSNSSIPTKNGVAGTDTSSAGSYNRPFASIDYAIGKCTASRGDIIAVLPGYTETITAAGGIAMDKAGVAIVGMGAGSLRPQLTLGAAAGSMIISAANTTVIGCDFIAGFALIVNAISITAAGTSASIEKCNFTESATNLDYVDCVVLTTLVDDVSFRDCHFEMGDLLADACIQGTVHDRLWIEGCTFFLAQARTAEQGMVAATDVTSSFMKDCSFANPDAAAEMLDFSGTCTGIMRDTVFSSIDTAGAISDGMVNSGFLAMNCQASGEADAWGIVGGANAAYS